MLQEAGLPAALSSYCEEFSKVRGLAVSCETDESVEELSPGAALCLYRIAQEALGNAAKHSEGKKLRFGLPEPTVASDFQSPMMVLVAIPTRSEKSGGLG